MPKPSIKKAQDDFLNQIKGPDFLTKIFGTFPDTHIFVKDKNGKHMMVNSLLAEGHKLTASSIFGKKVDEFCDPKWAEKYAADDEQVINTGKPLVNREERVMTQNGMKWFSTTKMPLFDKNGNVIGLVGVTRNIETQKALLRQIKRQKKQLEELSKRDSLTGCYNQRYVKDDLFNKMLSLNRSGNKKMAVLMFDLDHFKAINDRFGHLGGDKVLIAFCNQIRKSLRRQTDNIIRLGGDEFMVALFGTDKKGALHVAAKILDSIKRIKWTSAEFKGEKVPLKTSIGVTNLKKGDSMEDLLKRADKALYSAKSKGRNRVEYVN